MQLRGAALMCCASFIALAWSKPAMTQGVSPSPSMIFDDNGVDINTGQFSIQSELLSIGGSGTEGLSYEIWDDQGRTNHDISVGPYMGWGPEPIGYTVFSAKYAVQFSGQQGSFTDAESKGRALSYDPNTKTYLFVDRDGIKYLFDGNVEHPAGFNGFAVAPLKEKIFPSNVRHIYHWRFEQACIIATNCSGSSDKRPVGRIQSITSSNGYQLKFAYARNANADSGTGQAQQWNDWRLVTRVTAINMSVEACPVAADLCTLSQTWPHATAALSVVGNESVRTYADTASRSSAMKRNNSGYTALKSPGSTTFDKEINRVNGVVTSYVAGGQTWNYSRAEIPNPEMGVPDTEVTVTSPSGHVTKTYLSSFPSAADITATVQNVTKTIDAGGNHWRVNYGGSPWDFFYPTPVRLNAMIKPQGQETSYSYDSRANRVSITSMADAGSDLTSLSSFASFTSSCTNVLICNKPETTTDASGRVTNYTYDPSHGGVTSITHPASAAGAAQPQQRFSYSSQYAWYKNASGTLVQAPTPVWKLTEISECSSGAVPACIGTAAETRTIISYGIAGTANNLLPTSITVGSGNISGAGAVSSTATMSYDANGNVVTIDGPLAGTNDAMAIFYNAAREVIGSISPDPDAAGALKRRATRVTFDNAGRVAITELGTVNGVSNADWIAFVSLQSLSTSYDPITRRRVQDTVTAGGQTHQLIQYIYDAAGRPKCTAVRIGLAASSNVCQQLSSALGYDVVTEAVYGADGRVLRERDGGTDTISYSYTPNGQVASLVDAEANVTSYSYDGHDRPLRTTYPGGSFEQLAYDANGNVLSRRLRDGQQISYAYDALNRVTRKDVPNAVIHEYDVSYSYDLLGRLTEAVDDGTHFSRLGYDALGRKTSEQSNTTTRTFGYDVAGRRTRTTWGDGFYVTYDYDVTGNMTAIRENGAASGLGLLASYAYDDLGRRTSVTRGNGTVTNYNYDPVSRMMSLGQDLAGTANDLSLGFTYNPAGQIQSATRSNDTYAWGGHYNVDRLYGVNGLNQLTSAGATALGYDGRGNLTNSGGGTYGYTSENRLATAPGGYVMTHDPLGRYHWIATGAHSWMQYDDNRLIEERDGAGVARRYVHGPGTDEPIVWYEGAGTADRRWLHADERGSIIAVSDASGNAIAINRYDEYGIPASGNIGRFQYTGQKWIPELGMYDYKARIYSPTLGRFMQTDPIGYTAGINLYTYVKNDPVNHKDPTGLNPFVIGLGGQTFQSTEPQQHTLTLTMSWDYTPAFQSAGIDLGGGINSSGSSIEASFGSSGLVQHYQGNADSLGRKARPCTKAQRNAESVADRAGVAASGTALIAAGLSGIGAIAAPIPGGQGVSAAFLAGAQNFAVASTIFGSITTVAQLAAGQPEAVAIEKGVAVSIGALLPGAGKYVKEVIINQISGEVQNELMRCAR